MKWWDNSSGGGGGAEVSKRVDGLATVFYNDEKSAAFEALATIWDASIEEQVEYGGVIYKLNGHGLYGFTVAKGQETSFQATALIPTNSTPVAVWHTHPRWSSTYYKQETTYELKWQGFTQIRVPKTKNVRVDLRLPSQADVKAMNWGRNSDVSLYTALWTEDKDRPVLVKTTKWNGKVNHNDWGDQRLDWYESRVDTERNAYAVRSDDRQVYKINLLNQETGRFTKVSALGVTYTFSENRRGQTHSLGWGPVSIDTNGNVGLKGVSGQTPGPGVCGSVSGRVNLPIVFNNIQGLYSGTGQPNRSALSGKIEVGGGYGSGQILGIGGFNFCNGSFGTFRQEKPGPNY